MIAVRQIARLVVLSCLLVGCATRGTTDPTLADVISAHTRARGGHEAIERVRSVEIALGITESTYTVDALYRATRDRRMRIDVYSDQRRVYTEAFDGEHAWQQGAADVHGSPGTAAGAAALLRGIEGPGNLVGLHEAAAHGVSLTALPRETLDGLDYDVIRARFRDGFETFYYLNARNHLLERQRDFRALHPDMDPKQAWIEQRYSDFRPVEGRLVSFEEKQVDLKTGAVLQTSIVHSVRVNPVFSAEEFIAP